jgi:hypothetical protein
MGSRLPNEAIQRDTLRPIRGISREVLARDAAWSLANGACKDLTARWAAWEQAYLSAEALHDRAIALVAPAEICAACPITAECADLAQLSGLPVSVTPQQGESIESWLEHLADANGLTTAQLLSPPAATAPAPATSPSRHHPRRSLGSPPSPASTRTGRVCRDPRRGSTAPPSTSPASTRPTGTPTGRSPPAAGPRPRHPDLPGLPRRDRRLEDRVAAPARHRLHRPRRCPRRRVPRLWAAVPRPTPLPPAPRRRRHRVREPARPGTGQAVPARPHHHRDHQPRRGCPRDPGARRRRPRRRDVAVLGQPASPRHTWPTCGT